jgi:hypothetical protein
MTKQELENQANAILSAAKATVELQGDFPMTILLHKSGEWRHLPFPEEAGVLLNDGTSKDLIFGTVRQIVQENGIDGVIFATGTWVGEATPEGMNHVNSPEWKELYDFGFVRLAQRGWVIRCEAFTITAQSATNRSSAAARRCSAICDGKTSEAKPRQKANYRLREPA